MQDLVKFAKMSGKLMNADPSLETFDFNDLTKVFDLKSSSSDDSSKILYRYFLKYFFKGGLKNAAQGIQDVSFFQDEEINLFRITLRESLD